MPYIVENLSAVGPRWSEWGSLHTAANLDLGHYHLITGVDE